MCWGVFVRVFVCVFVCLSSKEIQTSGPILVKFGKEVFLEGGKVLGGVLTPTTQVQGA